jgi:hypothetical protein
MTNTIDLKQTVRAKISALAEAALDAAQAGDHQRASDLMAEASKLTLQWSMPPEVRERFLKSTEST